MWLWRRSGDDADVFQWLDVQDEVCRSRVLLSFLDANSVERVAIDVYTGQGKERQIRDYWFALSVTKKAATTIP